MASYNVELEDEDGFPRRPGPPRPIERGAQNLPGNWESRRFNLPALIAAIEGEPVNGGRCNQPSHR
ncbi:MAG: hypothetical protein ACREUT_16505 [Steroidobacteraceae bacterium]